MAVLPLLSLRLTTKFNSLDENFSKQSKYNSTMRESESSEEDILNQIFFTAETLLD